MELISLKYINLLLPFLKCNIVHLQCSYITYLLLTYLLTYVLTYILIPWRRVLPEKLTISQLVKIFPQFYGTRRYITAFTRAHPPVHILNQIDPFHIPTSHYLKIHLTIILPSTPGSPKWSRSFRFPHQTPVLRLSSPPYALHYPPISFFSILSPKHFWVSSTGH